MYESNIRKMYALLFFKHMFFVSGVLIPFYLDWGGITFFQVTILQSIFVLSAFAFEVPTGAVADRWGRKASLVVSGIVSSVAVIVYSSYPNIFVFALAEVLWALGFALLSGADEALIYDSLRKLRREHESKQVFGKYRSWEIGGIMIAGPLGSLIAVSLGLRLTMLLTVIPMSIAFAVALTLKEPRFRHKNKQKGYFQTILHGVLYFKDHKVLKILAFDNISFQVLVFFIIWTNQLKLIELGLPIVWFGVVHAALAGAQVLVMSNFQRIEGLFGGDLKFLRWSALLSGACFILLGLASSVWLAVVMIVLIGGLGLSRPVLFINYFNKHIKSENRATVLSTISMIGSLLVGMLYPLMGLFAEYSLNMLLVAVGVLIIGLNIFSKVRSEHLS